MKGYCIKCFKFVTVRKDGTPWLHFGTGVNAHSYCDGKGFSKMANSRTIEYITRSDAIELARRMYTAGSLDAIGTLPRVKDYEELIEARFKEKAKQEGLIP